MENCSPAGFTGVTQTQKKGIFSAQTTGHQHVRIPALKSKAVVFIHVKEQCQVLLI